MKDSGMGFALNRAARLRSGALLAVAAVAVLLVTSVPAVALNGTITVTNVSCSAAGYSFAIQGSGFDPNTVLYVWVFDNLNPGPMPGGQGNQVTDGTGSFTLDFHGGPGQRLPAQVEVTDTAFNVIAGPITVDPSSCAPPFQPDLVVSTSTTATTVNAGDPIIYTVKVTNQGTAAAPSATLADSLTGATITSMTASPVGQCWPPTCGLGTLAIGQTVTLTVIATASTAGTVTNSATAATTAVESVYTNNTAAASPVTVIAPDLVVSEAAAVSTAKPGNPIPYTITVSNQGNASAPNVTLTETPTGATIASMNPGQGTCVAPTCALGTIVGGSSATVTVVLTASAAGTVSNTASAATPAVESAYTNNTAAANPVTVIAPDLAVTKTTTATNVVAGASITYTVAVTNQGGSPAPAVTLTDTLAPGTTGSTITSMTARALGTIAPGATVTVTVVVHTSSAGTVSNSASATTTGETNLANNTGTASNVTVTAAPVPAGCGSGHSQQSGEHRGHNDADCEHGDEGNKGKDKRRS